MVKKRFSKRRGKYGRSKYRAFLVMRQLGPKYGRSGWLATREIVILAGISYKSLSTLLSRWVSFQYVERRSCPIWGRGDFEYRLLTHGSAWLRCAQTRLYKRKQFSDELRYWLNQYAIPNYSILLSLPFTELVATMSTLAKEM